MNEYVIQGVYYGIVAVSGLVVILGGIVMKLAWHKMGEMQESIDHHDEVCENVIALTIKHQNMEAMLERVIQYGIDSAVMSEKLVAIHARMDDLVERLDRKGLI